MLTLAQMKDRLRVSGTTFDTEIEQLMAQAQQDLTESGIVFSNTTASVDLADLAIEYYCKANFGYDEVAMQERMEAIYQGIKARLAVTETYRAGDGE